MLSKEEEIKIAINKINELIYEMFLKDLKSGNISSKPVKSYGKILNKRGALVKYDNPTLFKYDK
jgi:hypothetical protein